MNLVYSFTVALFITIAVIPLLLKYSVKMNLIDAPGDERKVHTSAIPRSGGLAMAIGIFSPLFFLLDMDLQFKGLFFAAIVIVFFGLLDDRYELNYKWKFAGQIIAVLLVMQSGVIIRELPFFHSQLSPIWLSLPITFLFILGVTNAVNLTDGLDGLAAGISLISLALITIFALKVGEGAVALFAVTVVGGIMGFLRFNTHPAKIFMGDAGSQMLGFITAVLSIMVTQSEVSPYSSAIPLLIVGLPILDTFTVMAIRLKEGRSPFSPDKNHLHHQLMAAGLKHHEAVAIIYLLQIFLAISAYFICYVSDLEVIGFYALYCFSIVVALLIIRKAGWRFRKEVQNLDLDIMDRRNKLLRKLSWIYHHSAAIVALSTIGLLIWGANLVSEVRTDFAITALLLIVVNFLLFRWFNHIGRSLTRVISYTCAVFIIYLISQSDIGELYLNILDGLLIALALFLMLAIRMTRKEQFRLDNQDLLVLLMIIVVPQLPFETLTQLSVGQVVLRLAVLLYSIELVLAKSSAREQKIFNTGVAISLIILVARGLL